MSKSIKLNALVNYKKGNLGATLLALVYLIFPWFNTGTLDPTIAIFGLMFLTIAVMRAKPKNSVISGLCQAFIGIIYLFAITGIIPVATLWTLTLVLAAIFFILELGFVKFGPTTSKADAFQIVPLTLLAFGLIVSILGYSTLFVIDWQNTLVALNYVAILLFCLLSLLQVAGWNIAGKSTNTWIMVFAIAAIATLVLGTTQGTLWQWR